MTRVTRLPGDHSQVGWLPPSSVPYHYSEKDSSPLTRGKLAARQRRVPQAGFIPAHAGKTRWLRARSPPKRAHSRSRGENWIRRITCGKNCGSFPLTRGKHPRLMGGTLMPRLIPAHAGKTPGDPTSARSGGAHPRSRGENPLTAASSAAADGSSPLTRGKQAEGHALVAVRGLIPAHAGKTAGSTGTPRTRRAHPRSRGENYNISWRKRGEAGSSPLTRGKLTRNECLHTSLRLIPAHAGKTAEQAAMS